MTRKKVKLAYIVNDSARKATYKKRKKGLIKKVSELSKLCGIDSCAIIYSPYDDAQPEVWPDECGAHRVVEQFKRMPEMEQSRKMMNQEGFVRGRISKVADQVKKVHKNNQEKEIKHLMFQCLTGKALKGLPLPDLNDLGWVIDQNLKEIYKRIDGLKKAAEAVAVADQTVATAQGRENWFGDLIVNPVGNKDQRKIGGLEDVDKEHPDCEFGHKRETSFHSGESSAISRRGGRPSDCCFYPSGLKKSQTSTLMRHEYLLIANIGMSEGIKQRANKRIVANMQRMVGKHAHDDDQTGNTFSLL
ncbi:agamous-like MADS-box protein AGL80 [Andrographis paniculata]|uniref:agamous-like MADS-box protein AGL80 n=1 Tax=Andrographis paniculata TaxID=175694 RepID=UPI0021E945BB|nr:agamous-like MADS-box protein AGL80 [Andrographis paniculata]